MNRTKLFATVGLAVAVIAMMTSSNQSIYASPTTEDDGYTYPDDATEEEKEEIDEREQEAWEDAGRPGEIDEDNDDGNDDNGDGEEQIIFTCSDGSTVTEDEECPSTGPNPYCDQVGSNYRGVCHDRKDYSESTGLYPCNDGTEKKRWQDCKDATKNDNDSTNTEIKTTIIPAPYLTATTAPVPASTPAPLNTMDVTSCETAGTSDGKIVVFDAETFRDCKLHLLNDYSNTYYDGFIKECIKQVGQTEHSCVKVVKDAV